MPERQVVALAFLKEFAPAIIGITLAFSVAIARERRSGKSFKESFVEGFICASLSLGVITVLEEIGLNASYAEFFGVLIGFIGTTKLSEIAYNFMDLFIRRGK